MSDFLHVRTFSRMGSFGLMIMTSNLLAEQGRPGCEWSRGRVVRPRASSKLTMSPLPSRSHPPTHAFIPAACFASYCFSALVYARLGPLSASIAELQEADVCMNEPASQAGGPRHEAELPRPSLPRFHVRPHLPSNAHHLDHSELTMSTFAPLLILLGAHPLVVLALSLPVLLGYLLRPRPLPLIPVIPGALPFFGHSLAILRYIRANDGYEGWFHGEIRKLGTPALSQVMMSWNAPLVSELEIVPSPLRFPARAGPR